MRRRNRNFIYIVFLMAMAANSHALQSDGIVGELKAPTPQLSTADKVKKIEQMVVDIHEFIEQLASAKILYREVMKESQIPVAECNANSDEEYIFGIMGEVNNTVCHDRKTAIKKQLYAIAKALQESENLEEKLLIAKQQAHRVLRREELMRGVKIPLDELQKELNKLKAQKERLTDDMGNRG